MLKPQDIYLLVKLNLLQEPKTQIAIAMDLFISASEVNAGIKRLSQARLIEAKGDFWQIKKKAMLNCFIYGLPHFFPANRGEPTLGMRVKPEWGKLTQQATIIDVNPVWPDSERNHKGFLLKPLYHSVPKACRCDYLLYQWLMMVDVLRDAENPNQKLAQQWLRQQLSSRKQDRFKLDMATHDHQQIALFEL